MAERLVPEGREIIKGYDGWEWAVARLEKAVVDLEDRIAHLEQIIDSLEIVFKPVEFPGVDPDD